MAERFVIKTFTKDLPQSSHVVAQPTTVVVDHSDNLDKVAGPPPTLRNLRHYLDRIGALAILIRENKGANFFIIKTRLESDLAEHDLISNSSSNYLGRNRRRHRCFSSPG